MPGNTEGSVLAQQVPAECDRTHVTAVQRDLTSGIQFMAVDSREAAITQNANACDSRPIEFNPHSAQPDRGVIPNQVGKPLGGTHPFRRGYMQFVRGGSTLNSGDDVRQAALQPHQEEILHLCPELTHLTGVGQLRVVGIFACKGIEQALIRDQPVGFQGLGSRCPSTDTNSTAHR